MLPLAAFLEVVGAVGASALEALLSYVTATQAIELLKGKSLSELTKEDMIIIAGGLKRFIGWFEGKDLAAPGMRDAMDNWNRFEGELNKRGYTIQQLTGDSSGGGGLPDADTPEGHLSQMSVDLARISQAWFGSASQVNVDRTIATLKRIGRLINADEATIMQARAIRLAFM